MAAVRKRELLTATEVKINGSEKKVNRNTCNITSIKRVTRKFLEVPGSIRAKQRQRNVQKSVLQVQSLFFLITDQLIFSAFFVSVAA